jgi:hypothetical protein
VPSTQGGGRRRGVGLGWRRMEGEGEREGGGERRDREEGCPGPGGVAQPRLGYSCLLYGEREIFGDNFVYGEGERDAFFSANSVKP